METWGHAYIYDLRKRGLALTRLGSLGEAMFGHPILDAIFNEDACAPSKQLQLVRQQLTQCGDTPTMLFVLPPASVIARDISLDTLYQDAFLLSHVFDARNLDTNTFTSLNGANWSVNITESQVVPVQGFPASTSQSAKITVKYLWMPGIPQLKYNATFMVLEVDNVLVTNSGGKRIGWFSASRSTPKSVEEDGNGELIKYTEHHTSPKLNTVVHRQPLKVKNPALNLKLSRAQIESTAAKVDYCLACLQNNVVTSSELAERFHEAVQNVKYTLEAAGGVFDDEEDDDTELMVRPLANNTFTLVSIYDYAEVRLGNNLLKQLDKLLEAERRDKKYEQSLVEIHDNIKNLDLSQVDIPNLKALDAAAFERAIEEAALVMGHMGEDKLSTDMCRTFLRVMNCLANPRLGTVSADTLLGLFMLTILRTSKDALRYLERNVYFVTHFSFQASNNIVARASAGRLSYTLMVVESVLLQLKLEYKRLSHLSTQNLAWWMAVRHDDRNAMALVEMESSPSILSSRRGKSALFMAIEDHNSGLLRHLLTTFSRQFDREFVLRDHDTNKRTLLMMALADRASTDLILDIVGVDFAAYFNRRDTSGRHVGYYANSFSEVKYLLDKVGRCIDWTTKDKDKNTAIIHQAKYNSQNLILFLDYANNFFDHIDFSGNSLLHFTGNNAELTRRVLQVPGCDVNWVDSVGMSALCHSENEEVARLLLEHGADPWLNHIHTKISTSTREARVAGNVPYVQNVSGNPSNKLIFKDPKSPHCITVSPTELASLSSTLAATSPTSWIPPLEFVYSTPYDPSHHLARMFSTELSFLDNVRLSSWLNQLNEHASFRNSSRLRSFYEIGNPKNGSGEESEKSEEMKEIEVVQIGSLFGGEDENSMLAFLELATEQLESLEDSLSEFVRSLTRVSSQEVELAFADMKAEVALNDCSKLASIVLLAMRSTRPLVSFRPLHEGRSGSYADNVRILGLSQLSKYAADLRQRLLRPLELADELGARRFNLAKDHETLRALAEAKAKPAWLGLESKRAAEIQSLELNVANGRHEIARIETELRATHYCLANELSAFNRSQETLVLHEIEKYSQTKLQRAKDSLSRLQFGYMPRKLHLNEATT